MSSRSGQLVKINFARGEKFSYSGDRLFFLQRVVEKIISEKSDAFMRRTVLNRSA